VDGTGLELCPVVCFGINSVESSAYWCCLQIWPYSLHRHIKVLCFVIILIWVLVVTHCRPEEQECDKLVNVTGVGGATVHGHLVVCYVSTWSVYRVGRGSWSLDDLDPTLCTHLVYAFAGLDNRTNTIRSLDEYRDLEDNYGKGGLWKLVQLVQVMEPIIRLYR